MNEARLILHLRIIAGLLGLLLVAAISFGIVYAQKIERMTVVVENVNVRVNQMADAAAPVGRAAVQKGVEVIQGMDAPDLSKSTSEGLKNLGNAAKAWAEKKMNAPATQP